MANSDCEAINTNFNKIWNEFAGLKKKKTIMQAFRKFFPH